MTQVREWKRETVAEEYLVELLERCAMWNEAIQKLSDDLEKHTSSRLLDWTDHFLVGKEFGAEKRLQDAGFEAESSGPDFRVFYHPGAQLPRVVVQDNGPEVGGLAVKAESIADFLMVRGVRKEIEGSPLSGYRRCKVKQHGEIALWVVERRCTRSMVPTQLDDSEVVQLIHAAERWQTRPRRGDDDANMDATIQLAEELAEMVGTDAAAWIALEGERKYWQSRNAAGQRQKARQDHLGMGWANHDHHTFRSSRRQFHKLVRLFEVLGFHCRERFYAGEEAGWGAQVMENSNAQLVLFLDVDMASEELSIDFSHEPLPERPELGTVGLWCGLHGDSVLQAGMHHLEAQFLFEQLREDLAHEGIGMMDPFSNFDYLKQAFTAGQRWQPIPERVELLKEKGLITADEADNFNAHGAVGSHLENLQRRDGYKGFNQKNVSYIIKKTDPRQYQEATGA